MTCTKCHHKLQHEREMVLGDIPCNACQPDSVATFSLSKVMLSTIARLAIRLERRGVGMISK